MANNELSGPLVQTALYKLMLERPTPRYTYRFVYAPETIGDLAFLSREHERLSRHMAGGAVLSMLGNDAPLTFRRSRPGNSNTDRAAKHLLRHGNFEGTLEDWTPMGGMAQRQYCSPGLKLPLAMLSRGAGGNYPEYHTSLDTRECIRNQRMDEALRFLLDLIEINETNDGFTSSAPMGEPFLRKHNLAPELGGKKIDADGVKRKYLLQYADGHHDLLEVADLMETPFNQLSPVFDTLTSAGLLKAASE